MTYNKVLLLTTDRTAQEQDPSIFVFLPIALLLLTHDSETEYAK